MSLHNRVRSPAYVRVHRVGARLRRPLRQSGDLVAIVRCDLTRPIPAAKARVPLETFVASREEVLGELTRLRQSTDPAEQEPGRCSRAGSRRGFSASSAASRVGPPPTTGPIRAGGGRLRLRRPSPRRVHCLDAYTIPELRGNIHAALLREMLLFKAGLAYRYGYSKITVTNRQSPKAHRRLGWERTGTMLLAGRASGIRVVRLSGSTHPWRRLRPEDY
jgi:hypothetical protein